jgi:hypothetical protein
MESAASCERKLRIAARESGDFGGSDATANVRAADIAEAHILTDFFVCGEQLPANVNVQRRHSNVQQLFEAIRIVIVD